MDTLKHKTLFITGASRGIGKAIALRAARDGANVVVAAKTAEPDPRLPGTVSVAAEVIGQKAVRAAWKLGDGMKLTIITNLGSAPMSFDPPPGRQLFPPDGSGGSVTGPVTYAYLEATA